MKHLSGAFFCKKTVFLSLCLFGLLSFSTLSYGCVVGPLSDQKAIKIYDVVFSGKLLGCFTEEGEHFMKYSVDRIWKGEVKSVYTVSIWTCELEGLKESIGSERVLFEYRQENSKHLKDQSSDLCGSSRQLIPVYPRILFGFMLPNFFDIVGEKDTLEDLGKPIHIFNK